MIKFVEAIEKAFDEDICLANQQQSQGFSPQLTHPPLKRYVLSIVSQSINKTVRNSEFMKIFTRK